MRRRPGAGRLALVGLALRYLSAERPRIRYLADASYWIYLLHLPLVLALQAAVAQLAWPWPVKFAIILIVAFAILLASYRLLVRHTWLGAWLNGKRHPRPTRIPQTRRFRSPPMTPSSFEADLAFMKSLADGDAGRRQQALFGKLYFAAG